MPCTKEQYANMVKNWAAGKKIEYSQYPGYSYTVWKGTAPPPYNPQYSYRAFEPPVITFKHYAFEGPDGKMIDLSASELQPGEYGLEVQFDNGIPKRVKIRKGRKVAEKKIALKDHS